ncbi:MAG: zinc-ribbon domain-containing protein [Desulfuromonadaceae bacterium]|nr:zinc-ribbon domain-containing protein [Desulfuromonadaceae bacterium]
MIIECPECQARFKLADEKIKPEGTKVRCSKCKHVFTVNASAPAPTPAPAPPEPAPVQEPVPVQRSDDGHDDSSLAFDIDVDDHAPSDDFADDTGTSADAMTESSGDFDFDFDDSSAAKDPFAEGDSAEDFTFGAPGESADDFAFTEEEPAGNEDAGLTTSGASDDAFGFKLDSDDTPTLPADSADEAEGDNFSFEEEKGGFDFGFDDEEPPAPPQKDAAGGEEFSFGDDDSFAGIEISGSASLETAPDEAEDESRVSSGLSEDTHFADNFSEPRREREAAPERPPQRQSAIGTFFKLLLLLFVLGIAGAGGYFYWLDGTLDIARIQQRIEVLLGNATAEEDKIKIRLSELNGYFVDNAGEGQLFVVEGKATNAYPDTRSALAVKGVIYGANGEILRYTKVYCGNPLAPKDLQTLSWDKIKSKMENPFGDTMTNSEVTSGKTLAFTIVFKNLPENLTEFSVEPLKAEK